MVKERGRGSDIQVLAVIIVVVAIVIAVMVLMMVEFGGGSRRVIPEDTNSFNPDLRCAPSTETFH